MKFKYEQAFRITNMCTCYSHLLYRISEHSIQKQRKKFSIFLPLYNIEIGKLKNSSLLFPMRKFRYGNKTKQNTK